MIILYRFLRSWMRNKLFIAEVLAILAFGLGANIAIFDVYNAAFVQFPFQDPGRILVLSTTSHNSGGDESFVSSSDLQDWTAGSDVFEATALYDSGSGVVLAGGMPERVSTATVSGNLFSLLGVRPELGGLFAPGAATSKQPEAILTDDAWRKLLSANPQAVGQSLKIGDGMYVVRGVLPPNFRLFEKIDVWLQLPQTPEDRGARHFVALARLKNGRSLKQAKAELKSISQRLGVEYPDTNQGYEASAMALSSYLFRNSKSSFMLLFTTALLVLVIAIFNVANLFGIYLHSMQKEQAVELALGCPPSRIRNKRLGEFLALALIAGVLGLGLAHLALKFVMHYAPANLASMHPYLDLSVYGFAFLAALTSGLSSTLMSFVSSSRTSIADLIKGTSRVQNRRLGFRSFPRLFFLIFEITICVVLLSTAGFVTKSFLLLQRVNSGFTPRNLFTARLLLPPSRYGDHSKQALFWNQLLNNVEHLPGVDGAATMTGVPLNGARMNFRFSADVQPRGAHVTGFAEYRAVSPAAFHLLGIPIYRGRSFLQSDAASAQAVIVINKTMARNVFAGKDPLGKSIVLSYGDRKPRQIVGIVGDVKYSDLSDKAGNQIYVPYEQNPWPFMTLILRTSVAPDNLTSLVRKEVLKLDPELPLEDVHTMDEIVYLSLARSRFANILIFCFASVALILAATGVYGVISFAASQRSREVAIRIALGATRVSVLRLFFTQALGVLATGVILGLLGSFFSIRLFQSQLYRVQPLDPEINLFIASVILLVGMLACLVPAARAARTEPNLVMRGE